jgi:hypothetical protein
MGIQKLKFVPVDCTHKDCWAGGEIGDDMHIKKVSVGHGDIVLVLKSDKEVKLPTKGKVRFVINPEEDNFGPQISPDEQMIGLTVGTHKKCDDWSVGGTMFVNSELHFYSSTGKRLSICKVPGTFIGTWKYFPEGAKPAKQVVVASRWHHGATTYRLFDIQTGRERAKHMAMWENKKTMPAWLKAIYEEI